MRKFYSVLLILLSIAVGAVFLYSAYTKVYSTRSLESFEFTMVEFIHLPWSLASLASRFFVGLEAALGGLMVLHFLGRNNWVYKTALALVSIFSLYLIYLWITAGDKVNCGCFGDAIWMSPSTSLIKNVILIICLAILRRFHHGWRWRWNNLVAFLLLIAAIATSYIAFPIPSQQPAWLQKGHFKLDLSSLYTPGKKDIPAVNLAKGKYIIAFFSPTCPHCQMAAYKMHLMKEKNPSLPFFMVLGGTHDLTEFWLKTKASNIPYCRLDEKNFFQLAGFSWPVIDWVNNGWVEAQSTYVDLNQDAIENWLKK